MPYSPPFCPSPHCTNHHEPRLHWYNRRGFYYSQRSGKTQRYFCKSCTRCFSRHTFSLDYWVHQKLNYERIYRSINSASGILDIAREFGVTDKVILNRLQRLARQSIGMQLSLLNDHSIDEDLVIDGFESFVYSQYFPNNYTIAVGAESQFLYCTDYAQMRRKGRMTKRQKARRDVLNKKYPIAAKEIDRSFGECFASIKHLWNHQSTKCKELRTDQKLEYQRELNENRDWANELECGQYKHIRISSRAERNTSNPLMAVNYFDREIRKDQANHVRQTLQWSKKVSNSMDRMMIYGNYHNFRKQYRIKEGDDRLHAEVAGIPRNKIEAHKKRFFTHRYFISKLIPDYSSFKTWHRVWKTPVFDLRIEAPDFAAV